MEQRELSEVVTFRPTDAEREYLLAKIGCGEYAGPTDVIRDALRRLRKENPVLDCEKGGIPA